MNRYWTIGLSSVLALGACAQPETGVRAADAEAATAHEATLRTVQVNVTGMR